MHRLFLLLATLSISACGVGEYLKGDDNAAPPAQLQDIESQLNISTIWERSVGSGGEELYIKLSPAVAGGRVFAASRKGDIRAYDALTGERLWQTDTKSWISGGPGVGSGVVAVGTRSGKVIALSPVDGTLLWAAQASSEVLAAPRADDGVVVVRSIDGKLAGFSAVDGASLWIYDRGVPTLTLRGTSTPTIASGAAIAGFDGGHVVGLALSTGQLLWETRVAIPSGRTELERMVDIDGDLQVIDDTVYVVTFQGRTAALDLSSGAILWRREMSSHTGLGVDQSAVYVTDTNSDVWALDRESSASIWRNSDLQNRNLTTPVSFRDYVVVGDFEGYLHWLRNTDGQIVARMKVDSSGIIATPLVSEDTLFVYSRDGNLAAIQISVP